MYKNAKGAPNLSMNNLSARTVPHLLGRERQKLAYVRMNMNTYGFCMPTARLPKKDYGKSNFRRIAPRVPNCALNRRIVFAKNVTRSQSDSRLIKRSENNIRVKQ